MNIALTNQYKHPLYSTNCEFYNILDKKINNAFFVFLPNDENYVESCTIYIWIGILDSCSEYSSDVLQTIV